MPDLTTLPVDDSRCRVAALFETHGPTLYRFAYSVVRQADDATDVVQDVFVRLLGHLDRGGDTTDVRAWLFAVCANACRDVLRRRRRWLVFDAATERAEAAVQGDRLDEADRRRLLERAAGRLRPRDRLLLTLRVQGLSYRDIATASGIRESSVGRLLARATARWQRECRRAFGERHDHLLVGR
jgi:RNA polymerase sigma-70 factor (ECF subfamily)